MKGVSYFASTLRAQVEPWRFGFLSASPPLLSLSPRRAPVSRQSYPAGIKAGDILDGRRRSAVALHAEVGAPSASFATPLALCRCAADRQPASHGLKRRLHTKEGCTFPAGLNTRVHTLIDRLHVGEMLAALACRLRTEQMATTSESSRVRALEVDEETDVNAHRKSWRTCFYTLVTNQEATGAN